MKSRSPLRIEIQPPCVKSGNSFRKRPRINPTASSHASSMTLLWAGKFANSATAQDQPRVDKNFFFAYVPQFYF
jgi:hypothetical protein